MTVTYTLLVPQVRRCWWWAVVLLLTVAPVLSSLAHALGQPWYPESDDATIVLLSGDSLSSDPPLVGMVSTAGANLANPELHHPGPIEFYLLAPFTSGPLGPSTGSLLATAAVTLISAAGTVYALGRAWGHIGAGLGAIGVAAVLWGMGADAPLSVWNPHIVAMPFTCFLACALAVASGHRPMLVGLVISGSFVAQTHLSYLGLVGVIGLWVLAISIWTARRSGERGLRPLLLASAVGLLLWLPPLLQQVGGDPGNGTQIIRALRGPGSATVGSAGLDWLSQTIGIPGVGVRPSRDLVVVPTSFRLSSGVLLAAPTLALIGLAGLARRRRDLLAPVSTAAIALGAAAFTATRIPVADGIVYRYYGLWMVPIAVLVWTVIGWTGLSLLPPWASSRPSSGPGRSAWTNNVGLVTILVLVAMAPRPGPWEPWEAQRVVAHDLAEAVDDLDDLGSVVVRFRGATAYLSTGSAVVVAASRRAELVYVDPGAPTPVFPWRNFRRYRDQPVSDELWVVSGPPVDVPAEAVEVATTSTLADSQRQALAARRARVLRTIGESGVLAGPEQPASEDEARLVEAAVASPPTALDDGTRANLALRQLVTVPGVRPDELFTLARLQIMETEEQVRVYRVRR